MSPQRDDDVTTHFGFEQVPAADKVRRVGQVFSSVAARYDVMNDVMSMGMHRLWKRFAVTVLAPRAGERILDLAGGTGDLTALIAPKVGERGRVVLSDINPAMLETGRARLIDEGRVGNIDYAIANAEHLPFPDDHFDAVVIGFGLRNVTDKDQALREMARVLKPGGRAMVLEFSQPVAPGLKPVYDVYSFRVLPLMGKLIANDADSYRYLAESIRMHPDQGSLRDMMEAAGLIQCRYFNLTGGIVAIHRGYKA